jgi:hypothetical protein
MNKIQRKRLLKLADILDVADAEHRARGEKVYDQSNFVHQSCGTPACALGHYAAYSRRWELEPSRWGDIVPQLKNAPPSDFIDQQVRAEFGIDFGEFRELFGVDGCGGAKTAKQAAKYIRKFVARKDKELTKVVKAP